MSLGYDGYSPPSQTYCEGILKIKDYKWVVEDVQNGISYVLNENITRKQPELMISRDLNKKVIYRMDHGGECYFERFLN